MAAASLVAEFDRVLSWPRELVVCEALLRRREWIEHRALELRQRTGLTDDVLRQRKALIKRKPKDLELRLEQVATHLEEGDVRAADREVMAILRIDPGHLGALEASGRIYLIRACPRRPKRC